jgi:hypothetical protein
MNAFSMFDKIKKKLFNENFSIRLKQIENQQERKIVEEMHKEVEGMESKYSN